MSASKLDTLCADLTRLHSDCDSEGWTIGAAGLRRAIALLRTFDELAEFATHSETCERGDMGEILSCDCGLENAQSRLAAILEGQG